MSINPHLSSVLIEKVELGESLVRITVRTAAGVAVRCPGCGQSSGWEHSRYVRQVADEAIGGRSVRISVSVRRLYCGNAVCSMTTFVEQVDGLTERYQRRTPAPRRIVEAVAVALAGCAGARLLATLHHTLSSASVLNRLMRIPLPDRPTPKVVGTDEFALRKGHRYATIITNADTGERIEVLPDRRKDTVVAWVREHPGVQVLCRDGSGGSAQAVREADQAIVQVSDRWHLWRGLTQAVLKEVGAHASCWAKYGPPPREDKRAVTTRERRQQVHDLLERGVSMLECAHRLGVSLNTVKRHARHSEPDRMIRAPVYRACLVDAYRDHLRQRRCEDPAVPVPHLLAGIREQGHTGSADLLVHYINQGRVESDHAALSPRKVTGLLIRHPGRLDGRQSIQRGQLAGACPKMTVLTAQVAISNRFRSRRQGVLVSTPEGEDVNELSRWPGGRALYDPRPGEPRTQGPGVACRFYCFGDRS